MNLVPFLIKAHYTPDMKEVLEEKTKDVDYKTRILTDDQAIVVQNDTIKLLGGGQEIIL